MQEIREAAYSYLQLDLPIIPVCSHKHQGMSSAHKERCTCPGKTPILQQWTKIQTTSQEQLDDWFSTWPSMNIGLVLGQTQDWNIVAIDIDGEKGIQYFQELTKDKEVPSTVEFVTGGGGYRILYTLPEGVVTKKKKIFVDESEDHQEVAFLVTGQQTILPPSRHHNGSYYEWIEGKSFFDVDIAPAPQWIVDIVTRKDNQHTKELSKKVTPEEVKQEIPAGNRSNQLARLVGSYCKKLKGSPIEVILGIAENLNKTYCKPPLDQVDVEKMVESIYSSEAQSPSKGKGAKIIAKDTAETFLLDEANDGIEYRYDRYKEVFYRGELIQGPWKSLTPKDMEEFVINEYLNNNSSEDNNPGTRKEIVVQLKSILYHRYPNAAFGAAETNHPRMVVLNDGILNILTGELEPWDPRKYNHTVSINANWTIIDEEKYNEAREIWDTAMKSWMPDKEAGLFLQEYIGYAMTPLVDQRAAVFLFGAGANGKSLFIDSVLPLFKGVTAVTDPETMSKRFGTDNLVDKLLVQCADIDAGYMDKTGRLKNLIAGDEVQVEIKGGAKFNLRPACKMLFSANELPKTSDRSRGWYSRMRFVPFPNQFEQDPRYAGKLKRVFNSEAGRTALLHWAVEGYQRLHKNGLFTESESMQQEVQKYKAENDSVVAFVDTFCAKLDVTGDAPLYTQSLHGTTLFNLYEEWCEEYGTKPTARSQFTKRMANLGFSCVRMKFKTGTGWKSALAYSGMQLLNEDEDQQEMYTKYNSIMSLKYK